MATETWLVLHEPDVPEGYVSGGPDRGHMIVAHVSSAQEAVAKAVAVAPRWADGKLWAVPMTALTRVHVDHRYDFRTS